MRAYGKKENGVDLPGFSRDWGSTTDRSGEESSNRFLQLPHRKK
ncbi:hypothetical protein [Parageobacillus thermoglucosidasius]|nr:hypothetical protein [Parageobacillus thermoglucosidasius]